MLHSELGQIVHGMFAHNFTQTRMLLVVSVILEQATQVKYEQLQTNLSNRKKLRQRKKREEDKH